MTDLETRVLGNTGVPVTTLGFGAMELRGGTRGRQIGSEDAGKLLNAVLDSGINFIDTSIDYGYSEELIGEHISNRRNEYFLASKCGCQANFDHANAASGPGPTPHVFTPENIIAGVDQSLRRMKTDHLDLVQVHISPSRETLEESGAVDALKKLKADGKVRFIGMSGTLPHIRDHLQMDLFDAYQIPYSALQREHEAIIDQAAKAGAGTIIRGGAARGAPEKGWENGPIGVAGTVAKDYWETAKLDELLDGMSRMEFTVRFTISHPGLHTTIVGTLNPDHLKQNLEAVAKGPLPSDLYDEAKRRLSSAGANPA